MTPLKDTIETLRKLSKEATQGPWVHDTDGDVITKAEFEEDPEQEALFGGKVYRTIGSTAIFRSSEANQELIALMRNSLDPILDRLEKLEADRCAMREALDHITCRKRIDRYNCTLETVQEFARDCLAKLEETK